MYYLSQATWVHMHWLCIKKVLKSKKKKSHFDLAFYAENKPPFKIDIPPYV